MITNDLVELKAPRILVEAADLGLITRLECAMPVCSCPDGRSWFEPCGARGSWMPTPDRWPTPGYEGGAYQPDNVRLAHARCNYQHGSRVGIERLRASGWYGSDKQREGSRRAMRAMREGWAKTPEGRDTLRRNAAAGRAVVMKMPRADRVRGGKAGFKAMQDGWMKTPESHEHHVRIGRKNACKRWNIDRGKPCTCGSHGDTPSAPATDSIKTS